MSDEQKENNSFGPDFMSNDIPIFQKEKEQEEEWKVRLSEEAGVIDDKVNAEKAEKKNNTTDTGFMRLISLLGSQAYIFLGAVENPGTGTRTPNLEQARESIDSLAALARKSAGNVSEEEDKLLKQVVSELQMLYVEMTRAPAPPDPGGAPAG